MSEIAANAFMRTYFGIDDDIPATEIKSIPIKMEYEEER